MSLIQIVNLSIAFGDNKLLDRAELTLRAGQRVGLLGRNGEGKSTLINIMAGRVQPDDGDIRIRPGVRIGTLEQMPELGESASVFDLVATGMGEIESWIAEYQALSAAPSAQTGPAVDRMTELQSKLDACNGWDLRGRVEKVLSRLNLKPDEPVKSLSGGWQRRAALARALVGEPAVLLLDEPTNHLDIDAILWLEKQLKKFQGAMLFVTHDREFLNNVATDIVDLERGKLTVWAGDYGDYLRRKAAVIEAERQQNLTFDKQLSAEEVWIRKGIQARRTRNEGRVRALKAMRQQRAQRIQRQGNVRFHLAKGEESGKMVIEADDISFGYDSAPIVTNFSVRILRGDRVGLLGPNGVGKTTLLRLLLGQSEPDRGTVRHGTRLQIAYFDQLRRHLEADKSVIDAIGEGREQININGKEKHVISYLSDFLFTPTRARSPVGSLSGGERARVLLAKLFSKPTNLLVMDEPTNDLDVETLELLEEMLMQYKGTLLLVSHDRRFMDNVVTSTMAFEGDGKIVEYPGGYSDWLRQRRVPAKSTPTKPAKQATAPKTASIASGGKRKLSYNEQRELDRLPALIETLELEQAELNDRISEPDFYQQNETVVTSTMRRIKTIDERLEQYYERWNALES